MIMTMRRGCGGGFRFSEALRSHSKKNRDDGPSDTGKCAFTEALSHMRLK